MKVLFGAASSVRLATSGLGDGVGGWGGFGDRWLCWYVGDRWGGLSGWVQTKRNQENQDRKHHNPTDDEQRASTHDELPPSLSDMTIVNRILFESEERATNDCPTVYK